MRSSTKPLVSVIVTSHNKGQWLAQCLWSIFSQSYRPIEVVICDNGSIDGSADMIRMFEKIPWVKCIYHPERLGTGTAFNLTLSFASGKYIAMLGGDDVMKRTHLELVMAGALKTGADIVFGDIEYIDADGRVTASHSASTGLDHIFQKCSVGHATGVTKREVFTQLGGYDEYLKVSVDWEFVIRAVRAGKKISYIGKTGYQWRRIVGSDQVTMKCGLNSIERISSHAAIFRKYGLKGPCECGCGATGEIINRQKREQHIFPSIQSARV